MEESLRIERRWDQVLEEGEGPSEVLDVLLRANTAPRTRGRERDTWANGSLENVHCMQPPQGGGSRVWGLVKSRPREALEMGTG